MTTYVPTLDQLSPQLRDAVTETVARKAVEVNLGAHDVSMLCMAGRIVDLVISASEADRVFDGDWYGRAHELATAWSGAFGQPVRVVAGVLAITSPQTSWTRNRLDAHTILVAEHQHPEVPVAILADRLLDASYAGGSLLTQPKRIIEAALHMLRTHDVSSYLGRGPKVRSFYSNILDPVGSTDVTVDTHMIRALLGQPDMESGGDVYKATLGCKAPSRKALGYSDGLYPYFAEAVVTAAGMLDMLPSQVQAAAWCQWRRAQGAWGGTVDRDPVYLHPSTVKALLS